MAKILILGAKGTLGQELMRVFGDAAVGWDREDVDVLNFSGLGPKIQSLKPEVVINCVAYNDVDGAEDNPEIAQKLNADFVGKLASLCKEIDSVLVHFSTNYVFDGYQGEYDEQAQPHPLSQYGLSKLLGEKQVQANAEKYYLIRTAVLFGQKGQSSASKLSFVDLMLDLSQKSATIKAVADEVNSITYSQDLARTVKDIIEEKKPYGIYHVTNSGSASWYELAKEMFAILGKSITIQPVPSSDFPRKARRPQKAVLKNTKLPALRTWQEALKEYLSAVPL